MVGYEDSQISLNGSCHKKPISKMQPKFRWWLWAGPAFPGHGCMSHGETCPCFHPTWIHWLNLLLYSEIIFIWKNEGRSLSDPTFLTIQKYIKKKKRWFLPSDFFFSVRNSGLSKLASLKASGHKAAAVVWATSCSNFQGKSVRGEISSSRPPGALCVTKEDQRGRKQQWKVKFSR